jgi:hypothetical protein
MIWIATGIVLIVGGVIALVIAIGHSVDDDEGLS